MLRERIGQRVRYRELLLCRPRAARLSSRWPRPSSAISIRHRDDVVSGEREARRQAAAVHLTRNRTREVGGLIKQAKGWKVSLYEPAMTIHLEMLNDHAFYYFGKEPGAGGLPTRRERARRVSAVGRHRLAGRGVPDDAARLPGANSSTSTATRSCRARPRRKCARSRDAAHPRIN